MKKLKNVLLNNTLFCGTIGRDGFPSTSPISLLFEKDNRFYFCTYGSTHLFEDLTHHPYVAIACITEQNERLQLVSYIKFEENKMIKTTILSKNKELQRRFGSIKNPGFQVFYLTNGTAKLYDASLQLQQLFDIQIIS